MSVTFIRDYEFYVSPGQNSLTSRGDGATEAFSNLKKADQNNHSRVGKFKPGQLPPEGYSLLPIGYGLSVAYRILG